MGPGDSAADHAEGGNLGHDEWTEEQCVSVAAICPATLCGVTMVACPGRGPSAALTHSRQQVKVVHLEFLVLCRLPALDGQQAAEHGEEDLVYGQDYSEFELVGGLTWSASWTAGCWDETTGGRASWATRTVPALIAALGGSSNVRSLCRAAHFPWHRSASLVPAACMLAQIRACGR